MARLGITASLVLLMLLSTAGRSGAESAGPAIYIPNTGDGFDAFIAAAIQKKNVPARIVATPDAARLTLRVTPVNVTRDTAATKVMKLAFAGPDALGNHASASAQLVDEDGAIVWSYAAQGEDEDRRSLAEALVKRLKREFFRR